MKFLGRWKRHGAGKPLRRAPSQTTLLGVHQDLLWLHSMGEDNCCSLRLCAWAAKSETDVGEHETRQASSAY